MVSRYNKTACTIPLALGRFSEYTYGNVRPNWYLPVHLGGFGVPREFAPKSWRVTREQRKFAAQCVNEPSTSLFMSRMSFGSEVAEQQLYANLLKSTDLKIFERPVIAYGDYVRAPREKEEHSPEWVNRGMQYLRWTMMGEESPGAGNLTMVSRVTVARRWKINPRYKPMKIETIESYWNPRIFVTEDVPCPPPNRLRY